MVGVTSADADTDADAYRAGIVGAGGVAGLGFIGTKDEQVGKVRSSHAGGYEAADGIELVAIADVDAEKRDRFGET